jgi:uncharacterized membrane protein YsdA (DUF1294 family)
MVMLMVLKLYLFRAKLRSVADAVRIPEVTLLVLAVAGGSPGAMLSMLLFRHKIKKASFMFSFLAIVVAQGTIVYFLRDSIPWP